MTTLENISPSSSSIESRPKMLSVYDFAQADSAVVAVSSVNRPMIEPSTSTSVCAFCCRNGRFGTS